MPNPACTVNSSTPPVDVTGASTPTIALVSSAGATYWFLSCIDTDDTNSAATINASLSINQVAKTATFTAPAGAGSAVLFMSTVGVANGSSLGAGLDANFVVQPSYTTTFKVNVATSGGLHVLTTQETFEQSATFGWIVELNAVIRAGSSFVAPGFLRFSSGPQTLTHAQSGSVVLTDTTSAGFTVKLPTASNASDADEYTIVDSTNKWSTNNLTVTTDSGSVPIVNPANIGSTGTTATSLTLSSARASVRFKYDKTQGLYVVV